MNLWYHETKLKNDHKVDIKLGNSQSKIALTLQSSISTPPKLSYVQETWEGLKSQFMSKKLYFGYIEFITH